MRNRIILYTIIAVISFVYAGSIQASTDNLRNEIKDFTPSLYKYIDEEVLKQYLSKSGNSEQINMAIEVYSHITSAENMVVDWCKPYYKMTNYPIKLQNRFKNKKQKAAGIVKSSLGDNWELALKEMMTFISQYASHINKKQMDDDYTQTKRQAALDGERMSKKDFCKMIDDNADIAVDYKSRFFNQLYPNF